MKLSNCLFAVVSACIFVAPMSAVAQDSANGSSKGSGDADSNSGMHQQVRLEAESEFIRENPKAIIVKQDRDVRKIYGKAFSIGTSPIDSAERFRFSHAKVLGASPAQLLPENRMEGREHTQLLMYDPQTGAYKFTLVHYRQVQDDVPVFRGDLRLLVRNEDDFPLVSASSEIKDLGGFMLVNDVRDRLQDAAYISEQLRLAKNSVASFDISLVNYSDAKPVIWAGFDKIEAAPTLALTFIADNMPAADGIDSKWLFVTDIETGEILFKENQILEIDVNGNASAFVTEGVASEQCEAEVLTPMPYAKVSIGGTDVFADINGDFTIPNGSSSNVTVDSEIRGEFFEVFTYNGDSSLDGDESSLSSVVTPPGPVNFEHNTVNGEFSRGEVNAYYFANVVRDFVLDINPAYPVIGGQTGYSITVNEGANGFCPGNAQYQGNNLRFCAAGGGRPNTSWSSVIFHEYGHHLVQVAGSGQGQYGEGMGDVVSMLIQDVSGTGYGFFGDCGTPLREGDNTMQYPCSGEVHFCGTLISGCVWSLRNELLATNPGTYLDILAPLAINSMPLHTGSSITPQITIDYLTLDDDDGDIFNGTPHCAEICAGFGDHNMDCPVFDTVTIDYPLGRPELVDANQATVLPVTITSSGSVVGNLHHRIGTSGPFNVSPLTSVGGDAYEAELPAAACGETIQYFISSSATCGDVQDPISAPGTTYSALVATALVTEIADDFENDNGWTASSTATDGPWTRGIPVDCDRGDPPADFDGSGQCWLTDNSSANVCNSDVDNGAVTLTSPVFDISALAAPQVSYARWFSNDSGGGPGTDRFIVEVSDNGGGSWSTLETVGPTTADANPQISGGWFEKAFAVPVSSQFRIRFTAEDIDTQSVVEAGVDDFAIFDIECTVASCIPGSGDHDVDGDVDDADLAEFINCLLGPAAPSGGTPCECFDADFNGEIDLVDFATMQAAFTG
ncbi:MAG: hypothetical protein DHS20C16_01210 [Phycisphaerae bacterium]|nr:MAG: hypothetical protein DHS20C16_01210 [Phycisphaerae bacterium]